MIIQGVLACSALLGCSSSQTTTTPHTGNAPVPFGMRDLPDDQLLSPSAGRSGGSGSTGSSSAGQAQYSTEKVRLTRIPVAQVSAREDPPAPATTAPATTAPAPAPEVVQAPTPPSTPAPASEVVQAPAPPTAPAPAPEVVQAPAPPPTPVPPPAPPRPPQIDLHFVGDEVQVTINGRPVAQQHIRRTDNAIEITGTQGQVLQSIPIPQPAEHPPVMLGLRLEAPPEALVKHLGSQVHGCSVVISVMPDGPAFNAGIEDFDLITAVDGKSPATPEAIRAVLMKTGPGQSVVLTVRRGKVTSDVTIEAIAWQHVPLPAELQPGPSRLTPSPKRPGAPNMPADTNPRGRPAAAPQRTADEA